MSVAAEAGPSRVEPARLRVSVGYVYDNEVPSSFADSWLTAVMFDLNNACLLAHDAGRISVRYGTDGLIAARNRVTKEFLASGSDWLMMIDTDMGFAPEAMYQLLAVADPIHKPVVGGLCFASRERGSDGMNGFRTTPRPTIFDWIEKDEERHFVSRIVYPINQVTQCAATGAAFLLVHRSAFERVSAMLATNGMDPEGWFERARGGDGSLLGEDISFCMRLAAASIPVHVNTGVKTTHYKPMWLSEVDFWKKIVVPPATEKVDVIVPVMGRPEHAKTFMQSLRASTGLARVIAVFSDDRPEDERPWIDAGADWVLSCDGQSFAEKVNFGARFFSEQCMTDAPWIFIVGSDVHFQPGWLDHAQWVASAFDADVIGTNDLGNPRVMMGDHATHMLIRRSYIEKMGASWDGPGVVCHEGYRHWYVDDEIVTVAKQRDTWQMAIGSIVEHMHPTWGKGEQDDVYRLGQSFAAQDAETFKKRVKMFLESGQ